MFQCPPIYNEKNLTQCLRYDQFMQSTLHESNFHANIFIPGNPFKYQNKIFTFLLRGIKRHDSRIYILIEK